jgi:hypothetical protein
MMNDIKNGDVVIVNLVGGDMVIGDLIMDVSSDSFFMGCPQHVIVGQDQSGRVGVRLSPFLAYQVVPDRDGLFPALDVWQVPDHLLLCPPREAPAKLADVWRQAKSGIHVAKAMPQSQIIR